MKKYLLLLGILLVFINCSHKIEMEYSIEQRPYIPDSLLNKYSENIKDITTNINIENSGKIKKSFNESLWFLRNSYEKQGLFLRIAFRQRKKGNLGFSIWEYIYIPEDNLNEFQKQKFDSLKVIYGYDK
jgi:hypothetical protein